MEAIPWPWEQQSGLEICLPPVIGQPRVALPGALLPRGCWELLRAVATSLYLPLTMPPSFLLLPSAQHAVCQGLAPSEGEGGCSARAYHSEWRPELWVVGEVLYSEPFSSGHRGLWREKKYRLFTDYISERGESKWVCVTEWWDSLRPWCLYLFTVRWNFFGYIYSSQIAVP